jgi:hypothetical protein
VRLLRVNCEPDSCFVERVSLAGRFVAFVDSSIQRYQDDHHQRIIVVDLRSGRRYPSHEATSLPPDQLLVTDLVLRPTGRIAWIGPGERAGGSGYAVWTQGSNNAAVAVDAAPGIEPGSLALAGSRLYWIRAQQPQSQRLA